jgi:hypothetical protein
MFVKKLVWREAALIAERLTFFYPVAEIRIINVVLLGVKQLIEDGKRSGRMGTPFGVVKKVDQGNSARGFIHESDPD